MSDDDKSWAYEKSWNSLKNATDRDFEVVVTSSDGTDTKTLTFRHSPARALYKSHMIIRSSSYREEAIQPFLKADFIYEDRPFNEREQAIAAAFFDLGVSIDRAVGFHHVEEETIERLASEEKATSLVKELDRKKGKKGKHRPWDEHKDLVIKWVTLSGDKWHKDYPGSDKNARIKLGLEAGRSTPSQDTFREWKKDKLNSRGYFAED